MLRPLRHNRLKKMKVDTKIWNRLSETSKLFYLINYITEKQGIGTALQHSCGSGYSSESWTMLDAQKSKITSAEMKYRKYGINKRRQH